MTFTFKTADRDIIKIWSGSETPDWVYLCVNSGSEVVLTHEEVDKLIAGLQAMKSPTTVPDDKFVAFPELGSKQ